MAAARVVMNQALGVYMLRPAASISKFLRIVSLHRLGIGIFLPQIFSFTNPLLWSMGTALTRRVFQASRHPPLSPQQVIDSTENG
jgi:hypothetical protein